jgi:hypothetical protein
MLSRKTPARYAMLHPARMTRLQQEFGHEACIKKGGFRRRPDYREPDLGRLP